MTHSQTEDEKARPRPQAGSPVERTMPRSASELLAGHGLIRILQVESSALDAKRVRAALHRAGARLDCFVTSALARTVAALRNEVWDLVLCDYALPGCTARDVLAAIATAGVDVPLVLVAGALRDADALACIEAGAADYVLKDNLVRLPLVLARVLREKELRAREAAAQTRRHSQEEYRLLFQNNPQPMFVFDLETLELLAVNTAAESTYGYAGSELLHLRLSDLVPLEQEQPMRQHIREHGGRFTPALGTVEHRRKDGTSLWVELHSDLICFDARPAALVLVRDVTERKQAETSLRESEARLRMAVQAAHMGLWDWDLESNTIYYSPEWKSQLGYAEEEISDRPEEWSSRLHPDDLEPAQQRLRAFLADPQGRYECEYRLRHRDGSYRWIYTQADAVRDSSGRPFRMLGCHLDITERKRSEDECAHLAAAIEQSHGSVVITDLKGKIEFVNPAFTENTGYSREQALGRNPRFLKSGEHDQAFYRDLWDTILAGQTWQGEIVNRKRDKSLYTQLMTITPVRDGAGKLTNFIAISEDITERRALEEQLRQGQKMEAVGQLAGGIAHDFNNLLMVMRGFAELLHERVASASERRSTEKILEAADRAARLIAQLLAFSRKQVLAPRVLCLNDCVAEVDKLLSRVLGEHVQVELRPAPGLHSVRVDPLQIEQVLMNVGINARDAMPHGGRLIIETSNVTLDAAACRRHPEAVPGPYVLLTVSDTGCGMDADTCRRVFEPFFTTKRASGGTGLGLSTVYGIVEQSGGFVLVDSELGQGTTFKLYFPALLEPAERLHPEVAGAVVPTGHETILVVEDEDGVRDAMTEYLRRRGYAVLAAGNGADALDISARLRENIDLMVTDVVMPGMSGPELAQHLLEQRPATRVLYVSGYTGTVLADRLAPGASTAFLEKPFAWDALARKVREVLEHSAAPPSEALALTAVAH